MSAEQVRSDIMEGIKRIRLEGCVPTMRCALMLWQQYLTETKLSGLSADDERAERIEHDRVRWLLTEVFPKEESDD